MKILVLNAGSSSLKYAGFEFPSGECFLTGLIDGIGTDDALHRYQIGQGDSEHRPQPMLSYAQAFDLMQKTLEIAGLTLSEMDGIAHRVVHGGTFFQAPTRMTSAELVTLKSLISLAPLHNPANILGIETALQHAPQVPQVAVFDTAFHHTLPDYAYRYPLPAAWYHDYGVRRYGFHGTSHSYVAKQAAQMLEKPLQNLRLISLHLGNGASVCAIKNGQSVDTSMGFSPLEGLMMGTRCGDIDSSILPYMAEKSGLSLAQLDILLNKYSGLQGIAGTNDMRHIHQLMAEDAPAARLAFAMFCYRLKKYIGAYFAVLGGMDALIFTGGIGENDAQVRQQSCADLTQLGLAIDAEKNQAANIQNRFIQQTGFDTAILVIKTDETLEIAQQAVAYLTQNA